MSGHGERTGEPGSGFRLPEAGMAEDILRAWEAGEAELAGPDRLFAFADHLGRREAAPQEKPEEPEIWVSFELAGEIYALPVSCVEEIHRISLLTRVPHAPAPIRGITSLRGRVVAVVDLRVRLGLPAGEIGPHSRLVVVASRQRSIGLLVDAARQIVKLLPSGIQPAPADVRTSHSDFLRGIYLREQDLLILLDLDRVLWIPGELAAAWSAAGV